MVSEKGISTHTVISLAMSLWANTQDVPFLSSCTAVQDDSAHLCACFYRERNGLMRCVCLKGRLCHSGENESEEQSFMGDMGAR